MNEYMPDAPATNRAQSLAVPIAIIIGFAMIAAAIYLSGTKGTGPTDETTKKTDTQVQEEPKVDLSKLSPVTSDDHIRGNPNAPIVFIEYSDYDCPFCKSFHETMVRIMNEYGGDGKVSWVYRHFPLEQLHPSAPRIAAASECVAKLGGNDAFWKFSDLVFGEREINAQTNMTKLGEYAVSAGVTESSFTTCLESGSEEGAVEADFNNRVEMGGRMGTPFTVVVVGDQSGVIDGAQPYSFVKQFLDNLIADMEAAPTPTE